MAPDDSRGKIKPEEHSRQFARLLLARYPDWRPFGRDRREGEAGLDETFLEVYVPSANPQISAPWIIRVMHEEIRLEWVYGVHWHARRVRGQDWQAVYQEALGILAQWTSEASPFVFLERDGRVVEWGGDPSLLQPGDRIIVRSWRGTQDREERV